MKGKDRADKALMAIICIGLVFFFLIAPVVIAWGTITGRLDIETMEPAGAGRQEEFGGY